jgi:hypothetical protein
MAITALLVGPAVGGNQSVSYPGAAGEVVHNRFTMTVGPTVAVAGTVLEIGVLPPGCRVVDMVLESGTSGASVTGSVGIIADSRTPPAPPGSGAAADLAARTCGAEFLAAKALSASAVFRMDVPAGFAVAPANYERGIGIVTAGASTSGTSTVTLNVWTAAA